MQGFGKIVQVLQIEFKPELEYIQSSFLKGLGMGNQLMWRGLSGSDDLAWAGICCCQAYELTQNQDFLYYRNRLNGARGALHLFDEIYQNYYDKDNLGVFWDK